MTRVRRRGVAALIALALVLTAAQGSEAHESRPAYLQIDETAPGEYRLLWRTPLRSGRPLPVVLRLPARARDLVDPEVRELPDSVLERRTIALPEPGLRGQRIELAGLQATITDALVRVTMLDGETWTTLVKPSEPYFDVRRARGRVELLGVYGWYGLEHILLGYDHLLFVAALLLLVGSFRVLLATITAFTLAHSITLAAATLGVVDLPGPPVEASIALSLVLLAAEILRSRDGERGMASRWPWAVAFSFGLLHGFGFASALTGVGLPASDVPLALFSFNVGVELGQLAFVAVLLLTFELARRTPPIERFASSAVRGAPYAIGVIAAFWFFERLATFFA